MFQYSYIHTCIHTYTGSIYNSIYQSLIDIRNLSELLSETPDIVDEPGEVVVGRFLQEYVWVITWCEILITCIQVVIVYEVVEVVLIAMHTCIHPSNVLGSQHW